MSPPRLTRAERKLETRARLLAAAADVFARRGFHGASLDEVAEEAGFSKGAVYSNFEGKDDLFLALLDERFARRLEQVRAAAAGPGSPDEQVRRGADDFIRTYASHPDWSPLFVEFCAYAQREPAARERLAAKLGELRRAVAEVFEERAADLGLALPVPAEQLAAMTYAMATGVAMERQLDPDAVPDELFATMLALFFAGVQAAANATPAPA